MAAAAGLLAKYQDASSSEASADLHQSILKWTPDWGSYPETKAQASLLKLLDAGEPALKLKTMIMGNCDILRAALGALSAQEGKVTQWVLVVLYDMLREDCSCFAIWSRALQQPIDIKTPLLSVMQRADTFSADKAAWILCAVMGHHSSFFSDQDVKEVVEAVQRQGACSDLGALEAIVNLLKTASRRALIWKLPGVADRVVSIDLQGASSQYLYRCIFALWMLSFEPEGAIFFKEEEVIVKIRDIIKASSSEKVVRLALTVLRNFLTHKVFAEQVVELGVLEVVQALEYEKWRDSDMYDDIRDMSSQISLKVQEMSNFDRYERELKEGKLKWGFIHSSKFWSENVLKFEQNDFRPLKMLAMLLTSQDPVTLAVACHDLGEFVAMHPLGKKQISGLQVKERVMELMGSQDPAHRDVRREALLCCQKIMLNKWQDMETVPKQ
eukprot:CAMPEP_0176204266 /NCGR_PEP_ID=MMETSP0121_2-20121125/11000_1 /TAXON_ID=160619 /ORGANISM="Kryptoperidinium foliaceum, Strain CCMP 1326" /LENGTH=440 /DNA_ID=CAMNT_0017543183 /DNA_START=56 /DNA_END=1378 /DNA_ORIENTATION=+